MTYVNNSTNRHVINRAGLTLILSALVNLRSCTNGLMTAGSSRERCLGSAYSFCGAIFTHHSSASKVSKPVNEELPLYTHTLQAPPHT